MTMKNNTYYNDIEEMPIYNWYKVNSTGDYSFMLIKKTSISDKEKKKLSDHWRILYDQYLKEFGFSDGFLSILNKQCEIALMQIDLAETGDRTINTFIELEKQKLEAMIKKQPGSSSFYDIKAHAEKEVGFQIDIRKMSVMEFYTTLKTINSHGRRQD